MDEALEGFMSLLLTTDVVTAFKEMVVVHDEEEDDFGF